MRSLLFVPAVEKMLNKINTLNADAFIADLEDSIPDENKNSALESLKNFLSINEKRIYIRLNRDRLDKELAYLYDSSFEGVMIPKFERPESYEKYIDKIRNRKVIALVESPLGFIHLNEIASCEWVDAIAFGAEDYTSIIGMDNRSEFLIGIKNQIIAYAKAYHKLAYDTPCFILNDDLALEAEIQLSQKLGFDGKLAINPKHIPLIDKTFKLCDIGYIKRIIDEYNSSGEAVVKIDGKVYERMHIAHLKKVLKEQGN